MAKYQSGVPTSLACCSPSCKWLPGWKLVVEIICWLKRFAQEMSLSLSSLLVLLKGQCEGAIVVCTFFGKF